MTDQTVTDTLARQYLLGQLSEHDRQRVEEAFICDRDTRERLLMAEEDLIEDYIEGNLTAHEHNLFETQYLTCPQQKRKLRIARSLKRLAAAEPQNPNPPAAKPANPQPNCTLDVPL